MTRALTRIASAFLVACIGSPVLASHAQAAEIAVAAERGALIKAIETAQDGDTLRLAPIRYDGPVVIDKPLVLDGGGISEIHAQGTGSVITIAPTRAKIRMKANAVWGR